MRIQVRYFAVVREIAGEHQASWDVPEGSTVGELWGRLVKTYPRLQPLGAGCAAAVNQEYVPPKTIIHDGDDVAFIPPVSGG